MGTRAAGQEWVDRYPFEPQNQVLEGYQGPGLVQTLPVTVEGPVQTQALPTRGASSTQRKANPGVPERILNEDPRRSRAVLISHDDDMYVGFDQQSVASAIGALWPKNVPLTLTCISAVWVMPVTSASTISAIPEEWTR